MDTSENHRPSENAGAEPSNVQPLTERQEQLLQRYAEGSLQGDDLAEFQQLAQTNRNFRQAAELERRINQAIKLGQKERLIEKLKNLLA